MATLALGLVGAAVGGAFGVPGIGFSVGSTLGSILFGGSQQSQSTQLPGQEGPRLNDLKVQSSTYGIFIPIVYGRYRVAGNVIWATDIVERSVTTTNSQSSGGGKGGGVSSTVTQTTTTYYYYGNFAIGLCAGTIAGIRRIWADGKLIYDTSTTVTAQTIMASNTRAKQIRIYKGDEAQAADPLIEAHQGAGNVPGFRGLAYLVFEDFALADFSNRIPNITVEVVQIGTQTITLNHDIVHVDRTLPDAVGQAYDFDGGIIHTKIGGDEWGNMYPSPANPQRIDLDLNLNVVQRMVGRNLESHHAYHQKIKYMPNLFVTFDIHFPYKWYDVSTSKHSLLHGDGKNPRLGIYGNGTVYLVTGEPQGIADVSIIKYPVAGKFSVPGGFSQIINVYNYFHTNVGFIVDLDIKGGYLFATTIEQTGPKILAFDPNNLSIVKKWNLALEPYFPNSVNPRYNISLNSNNTKAILTRIEFNFSSGYLIDLDFNQSTISTYQDGASGFGGNGAFFFLEDNFVYTGGLSTFSTTSHASIHGINSMQPDNSVLANIVADICQRAGLSSNDFDISLLTNSVVGFTISQQSSARDNLTPLQSAYFFDVVESGFKLKFIPRGLSSPIIISNGDLAAREYGQEDSADLTTTRIQELDLPRRMNVLFTNINADYQQGNQIAQRIITQATNEQKIELSIAMNDAEAAKIADVLLYDAWTQRTQFEFSLSRKYAYLDPTDVVVIQDQVMRITNIDYGDPGILKVKAVMEDATIYTSFATGADVNTQSAPELTLPSPSKLFLLDIPILRDADDDDGFYSCVSGVLSGWAGASVNKSIDSGDTFSQIYSSNTPTTYGVTLTELPNYKTTTFDETSQLYVKLTFGTLNSTTELSVLNGANACLIGNEIVQFQYAELQPDGSYLLHRLLRGRRGTEWATGSHIAGEPFILIEPATWHRIHSPESEIGIERIYKAITYGRTLQQSYAQSFINNAVGKKPFSPVNIQGVRNEEQDLNITWIRRTRVGGSWRDYVDATIDPEVTGYEIDILDNETVVRTLTASDETVIYTAAQQITDFGTTQSAIDIKIHAIGQTVGRGFSGDATL